MQKIKIVFGSVAIITKPIDEDNLVEHILNGLGPMYDSCIHSIQAHETPFSMD